jgi:hypothetical protein
MMPSIDEMADAWHDTGVFAGCETFCELIVVLNKLEGALAVEELLQQIAPECTRDSLQSDAAELDRVGLKPLAAMIRRHEKRAKAVGRPTFQERWAHRLTR